MAVMQPTTKSQRLVQTGRKNESVESSSPRLKPMRLKDDFDHNVTCQRRKGSRSLKKLD